MGNKDRKLRRMVSFNGAPKYSKSKPITTIQTQTQRESDYFQIACWEEGTVGYPWFNYRYTQADWCYAYGQADGDGGIPITFVYIEAPIYIDGELSTNPLGGSSLNDGFDNPPDDRCVRPLYNGMWYETTGNCDAIAALWKTPEYPDLAGNIIGMDFVNNISNHFGIMIPIQIEWVPPPNGLWGYPSVIQNDEYIDDFILYKASTGTYHSLTDESRQEIFETGEWELSHATGGAEHYEGIPPIRPMSFLLFYGRRVDFGPPIGSSELPVHGDITGDGLVNILDIQYMVAMIRTGVSPEIIYQNVPEADFNGDGQVDVTDLQILINTILSDTRTTEGDRMTLQKELDKLNGI